jgi:hypothetical protein
MVRSWKMSSTWGPPCPIGISLSTSKVDFQLKANSSLMPSSVIFSIGRCHNPSSWACNDYFNWTSFIVALHIGIVDRWNPVCVSNVGLWRLLIKFWPIEILWNSSELQDLWIASSMFWWLFVRHLLTQSKENFLKINLII